MNSIKRLGILYGRLGLSTDPALIERRATGVAAVSEAIEISQIAPLVRRAFGLGKANETSAFLETLGKDDPTFDVSAEDNETALLAGAVLDFIIENEDELHKEAALAVVTASAFGLRKPFNHDMLLSEAERMLTHFQGSQGAAPADRTYSKRPATLSDAINSIPVAQGHQFFSVAPHVTKAFEEVGTYAEDNALAAARNDNQILNYVRRLETELRLYWWVTSGWSVDTSAPFAKSDVVEAAIRSGKELADKTSGAVGLFAAPAMLNMILERGRQADALAPVAVKTIASTGDRTWREETFVEGSGPLGDLLPISMSMHLAADSGDADDWHGRFLRLTGIAVDTTLDPVSVGLQLYRERLLAKALA